MSRIAFRAATPADVAYVGANLRKADMMEYVMATGRSPKGTFGDAFATCIDLHVATIDGRPVCVYGIEDCGDWLAPFLMGTDELKGLMVARAMIEEGRMYLRMWGAAAPLRNWVWAGNHIHVRYIKALGCDVGPPEPYGALGAPFREFRFYG